MKYRYHFLFKKKKKLPYSKILYSKEILGIASIISNTLFNSALKIKYIQSYFCRKKIEEAITFQVNVKRFQG